MPAEGGGVPPTRSASRRTAVTVVDQGFASVSNFIVGVAVARIAGPAGLGGFSLAYACWLVLAAQHRSLITDPMAIENDAVRPDAGAKLRAGLAAELLLATGTAMALLPVGVVLLATGQHTFGLSLVAAAPWFPFLALQDYWRWIGFMQRKPGKALANDTVYNCVQGIGFAAVAVSGVHSVALVIGSWGLGAAAGAAFGLHQFSVRPSVRGGLTLLRSRWHMSKWLAGNSLTGWGSTQASWLLSSFILGPAGLGGLRAAQTLVAGPTFVLIQAGGSVGLPEASRALEERGWPGLRRVALFVTGGGLISVGAVGTLVLVMGGTLLRVIYGTEFSRYWAAADLFALAYLVTAVGLGPVLVLKASRRTRELFRVQVLTMIAALGSVVALATLFGVAGAAASAIVSGSVAVVGSLWYCRGARNSLRSGGALDPAFAFGHGATPPPAVPVLAPVTWSAGEEPLLVVAGGEDPRRPPSAPPWSVSPAGAERAPPSPPSPMPLPPSSTPSPGWSSPVPAPTRPTRPVVRGDTVADEELGLSESWRAVRRRAGLVGAVAAVGLVAGLAIALHGSAMAGARAVVLTPPSPTNTQGLPLRDASTDVQIMLSPAVLGSAGHAVDPGLSYLALRRQVTVDALTPDVLQITAEDATSARAVRLANGVADRFVRFTTASSSPLVSAAGQQLQQQAGQLENQIASLQGEIASLTTPPPGSPAASSSSSFQSFQEQILLNLHQQEQSVTVQLDSVNNMIAQLRGDVLSAGVGTVVLTRAQAVATSPSRLPLLGVIGTLVGLFLGMAVAVVVDRRDRRLRRGADIAEVVGAPLLGSLDPPPCKSPAAWLALLDNRAPNAIEQLRVRRLVGLLGTIGSSPPTGFEVRAGGASTGATGLRALRDTASGVAVTVVSFADDPSGSAAALELAAVAAALGAPVALAVDPDHASAGVLGSPQRAGASPFPPRPNLRTSVGTLTGRTDRGALTVTQLLVDRDDPSFGGEERTAPVVVAVSSGFAVAEDLRLLAAAAALDGTPIDGVIVTGGDPTEFDVDVVPASGLWSVPVAGPGANGQLRADGANGQLRADGANGQLRADGANGQLRVDGANGQLLAESANGSHPGHVTIVTPVAVGSGD